MLGSTGGAVRPFFQDSVLLGQTLKPCGPGCKSLAGALPRGKMGGGGATASTISLRLNVIAHWGASILGSVNNV